MIIVRNADITGNPPLVATIGFFDGVHAGHRFLLDELKEVAAAQGLPSAVITFPEHPRSVIDSGYRPELLDTFDEKVERLSETGIDYCIVLPFTEALSRLSADEFITLILADKLQVKTLLIGYDHRFGHHRTDGFEQYVTYGARCGMQVLKASQYTENEAHVSSSAIRRLLKAGDVEAAAHLLTYPYRLKGTIVRGYQIGRKMGFPTANIRVDDPDKLIPGIGVYAVRVLLDAVCRKGMLYIGKRPTLENGDTISLEVNILDFEGDIYNHEIEVEFLYRVREDIKFDSIEALTEQLRRDRDTVEKLLDDIC